MTVEAWIYPTSIGTTQTLLDLTPGGTDGYRLTLESSGKISWIMGGAIGTGNIVLIANRWYHIAVVCETPSGGYQIARIYINGVYDNGGNYNEMVANTGKLRIGASNLTTNYFTGLIDEVRISNFAKTPAEIQRNLHTPILYINKPVAPQTTVAYSFDGNMYSGTRDGNFLKNMGCRFSYASEPYSPMFHMGYSHEATLDSFNIKHPFLAIPLTGTAGYTYDTLKINQSIAIDESKMKVFVSLNHSLIYDLKLELISPDHDSIVLVDQVYIPNKNITCVFNNHTDNLMSSAIHDNAPIIGSQDDFSIFHGKNSQGVWKLKVTDLANGNTGILNSWGLLFGGDYYSVNEHMVDNSVGIYPNPSNGKFTIDITGAQMTHNTLEIYNVLGERVFQSELTAQKSEIDLSSSPKGIYFVKIFAGAIPIVEKIVLQ
jgi:subtilisin-like proprotein convertase family protein